MTIDRFLPYAIISMGFSRDPFRPIGEVPMSKQQIKDAISALKRQPASSENYRAIGELVLKLMNSND